MGDVIYIHNRGKMNMATVFDVANFFLAKSAMSQKKLQKLVFYAYAWTLTLLNDDENSICNKLFQEEIQAWVHGPVCPSLYSRYKIYGWDNIPQIDFEGYKFSDEVIDVLEQVWEVYGNFTGNQLEDISHQEEPWKEARNGISAYESSKEVLKDAIIYRYYSSRLGN